PNVLETFTADELHTAYGPVCLTSCHLSSPGSCRAVSTGPTTAQLLKTFRGWCAGLLCVPDRPGGRCRACRPGGRIRAAGSAPSAPRLPPGPGSPPGRYLPPARSWPAWSGTTGRVRTGILRHRPGALRTPGPTAG